MAAATAEIGLIGLAVMGQNLALNVAEKVRPLNPYWLPLLLLRSDYLMYFVSRALLSVCSIGPTRRRSWQKNAHRRKVSPLTNGC